MGSILYEEDIIEQWRSLLQGSQAKALIHLEKELENYLIFLLIRFINKPELVDYDMGRHFLVLHHDNGIYLHQPEHKKLQSIGDHCLLFSGLFPGYAQRRGSNLSHIVQVGKNAYHSLADRNPLYDHLSYSFTHLMDVLLHLRENNQYDVLDMLQAIDLWENTHSQYAYQFLRAHKKTPH